MCFKLKPEACRLTSARKLLIAERLSDAGYEMIKRAVINASKSGYYRGSDDRSFKGTIEMLFNSYEKIENLANSEYDPYA